MSIPLVSFVLSSFNQREYIGEALRAALNQTYSNLEVIVADDCSTDGSVDLIRKIIAESQFNGGLSA